MAETSAKAKAALVYGPHGVGKSLLVQLALQSLRDTVHPIFLSADDERDKKSWKDATASFLKQRITLDGKHNVLVAVDIDSIAATDSGFISALSEMLKESDIPIVCIADEKYNQRIKPILSYVSSAEIRLYPPSASVLYNAPAVKAAAKSAGIRDARLRALCEESKGDIRFLFNMLQLGIAGDKDGPTQNIFETTGTLFSMGADMETKWRAYGMASDLHMLMIHENMPRNTLKTKDPLLALENMSSSAEALSDADRVESHVSSDLSVFLAIRATKHCQKQDIQFTQYLGKQSARVKNKRERFNYETASFISPLKTKSKTKEKTKAKTKAKAQ